MKEHAVKGSNILMQTVAELPNHSCCGCFCFQKTQANASSMFSFDDDIVLPGLQSALCGRPTKDSTDSSTQTRRGRQEYTKRKQKLRLIEKKNQPNQFKHWRGH